MTSREEPQDTPPPADGGTAHLRRSPQDAPSDVAPQGTPPRDAPPQDAAPGAARTAGTGRTPGSPQGGAAQGGAPCGDPDGTLRLRPSAAVTPKVPQPTAVLRVPGSQPSSARPGAGTLPDPRLGGFTLPQPPTRPSRPAGPPPEASAPAAPTPAAGGGVLIRFGPGVPAPRTARIIAVWRGEAPGPREAAGFGPGRQRRSWHYLLTLAVLLAVLGYLLWQRLVPPSS
ncbi:hypothetical protein [Streptomyces sp. JNUCC 63]